MEEHAQILIDLTMLTTVVRSYVLFDGFHAINWS